MRKPTYRELVRELAEHAPATSNELGPSGVGKTSPPKRGYSIDEFCSVYSICRSSTYVEIREGRLTARKVGRRTIIATEDAEEWFASLARAKAA